MSAVSLFEGTSANSITCRLCSSMLALWLTILPSHTWVASSGLTRISTRGCSSLLQLNNWRHFELIGNCISRLSVATIPATDLPGVRYCPKSASLDVSLPLNGAVIRVRSKLSFAESSPACADFNSLRAAANCGFLNTKSVAGLSGFRRSQFFFARSASACCWVIATLARSTLASASAVAAW